MCALHIYIFTYTFVCFYRYMYVGCTSVVRYCLSRININVYKSESKFDHINPFIAQACKIPGLKDARTRLQTVYFPHLEHIYFQCYAF